MGFPQPQHRHGLALFCFAGRGSCPSGQEDRYREPGLAHLPARLSLDVCGAPIGVQQKLMRHAQVSTIMQYGNAYVTEKRKMHGAVVQMVLPTKTTANAEVSSLSA